MSNNSSLQYLMAMFVYEHKSLKLGEKGPSPGLHFFLATSLKSQETKWALK